MKIVSEVILDISASAAVIAFQLMIEVSFLTFCFEFVWNVKISIVLLSTFRITIAVSCCRSAVSLICDPVASIYKI